MGSTSLVTGVVSFTDSDSSLEDHGAMPRRGLSGVGTSLGRGKGASLHGKR